MTSPLSSKEQATLAKMKAAYARRRRQPAFAGAPVSERFVGAIGMDDRDIPLKGVDPQLRDSTKGVARKRRECPAKPGTRK